VCVLVWGWRRYSTSWSARTLPCTMYTWAWRIASGAATAHYCTCWHGPRWTSWLQWICPSCMSALHYSWLSSHTLM